MKLHLSRYIYSDDNEVSRRVHFLLRIKTKIIYFSALHKKRVYFFKIIIVRNYNILLGGLNVGGYGHDATESDGIPLPDSEWTTESNQSKEFRGIRNKKTAAIVLCGHLNVCNEIYERRPVNR